jgi:hypothetical protein
MMGKGDKIKPDLLKFAHQSTYIYRFSSMIGRLKVYLT